MGAYPAFASSACPSGPRIHSSRSLASALKDRHKPARKSFGKFRPGDQQPPRNQRANRHTPTEQLGRALRRAQVPACQACRKQKQFLPGNAPQRPAKRRNQGDSQTDEKGEQTIAHDNPGRASIPRRRSTRPRNVKGRGSPRPFAAARLPRPVTGRDDQTSHRSKVACGTSSLLSSVLTSKPSLSIMYSIRSMYLPNFSPPR